MKNPLGHAIVVVARALDVIYSASLSRLVRRLRTRAAAREPPSVYKRDLVAAAFQRGHARGNASFVWLNAKTPSLPSSCSSNDPFYGGRDANAPPRTGLHSSRVVNLSFDYFFRDR